MQSIAPGPSSLAKLLEKGPGAICYLTLPSRSKRVGPKDTLTLPSMDR